MSNIKFLDEIVKELSEEFSIPEKEMDEMCTLSIKYIQKLIKTPGIISINLPKLGVLHFNEKRAKYSYKNGYTFKHYEDVIQSQLDLVEETKKDNKDLVHARNSYYTIFRRFFFKSREERKKSKKTEVLKKIEIKQNKRK